MVDTVRLIAYCGFVLVATVSIIHVLVPFWNWSLSFPVNSQINVQFLCNVALSNLGEMISLCRVTFCVPGLIPLV